MFIIEISLYLFAALTLLQSNAQGLLNHGQELIKYLNSKENSPIHLICIQETWFNDDRTLQIPNYLCVTRYRCNQLRGGCAVYIHDSVNYESPTMDDELELQKIKIHYDKFKINLVNFYNPCKKLDHSSMEKIIGNLESQNTIILEDFNSHNTLWGSENTDKNGLLVETFLNQHNLVLLNDGSPTRMDPHSGKMSHLDL